MTYPIIIRDWQQCDYQIVWQAMREFVDNRMATTADELWLVEHPAVYTLGQSGNLKHLLNPQTIPIVRSDRGGQVTYHGPGQLIVYVLVDLRRRKMGVRDLVNLLENSVINFLQQLGIVATARKEAPGVYVAEKKICSLGLRIRKGCSYHGLSLNIAMELEPFTRINPCGYKNLVMTQLQDLLPGCEFVTIKKQFVNHLQEVFGYNESFSD